MRGSTLCGCLLGFGLASLATAKPYEWIDRDLRVQVLSPTLLRLEIKGPKGFENRKTFTVVERNWPGFKPQTRSRDGVTEILLAGRVLRIPSDRIGLRGISIHVLDQNGSAGPAVFSAGETPSPAWLPAPGKLPPVFPVADFPRLVPPPSGAIPASATGELEATSGYDITNPAPDLYLFLPKTYSSLRKEFLRLTGPIPLIPRYLFGFIDSRWFPYSEESALAAIDAYQQRKLPLDVFVIDTDWRIGGSKGYTPDPKYFPDMKRFLARAHEKGVRVMANDHPEPQGKSALDPAETQYRYDGLSSMLEMGLDLWWFDRNWVTSLMEPMAGLKKEVWGASIFHDVARAVRPQDRPIAMSNVQGIDNGSRNYPPHPAFHRYPIYWTGDTASRWSYLQAGVRNAVDAGVESLLPFMSEDLGGHAGTPDSEQYVRWLQFGALSPIMRVHCTLGNDRRPWMFGTDAEAEATEAIRFRYHLLPTLYTAARQASEDGQPILRRLDLQWPDLPEAASPTRYLLGDDILVAPITDPLLKPRLKYGSMAKTATGEAGFQIEFFAGQALSGPVLASQIIAEPRFDWGDGAPHPKVPANNFSARVTGQLGPFSEPRTIRLLVSGDDGFRLYAGGNLVIDAWKDQAEGQGEATVTIPAGVAYPLRLEYYEASGAAKVELAWADPTAPAPTPTVSAWIPPGTWRDLWSGAKVSGPANVEVPAGLSRIPLWIRDGSILFLGAVTTADRQLTDTMTVEVFAPPPGKQITRTLYEDDGKSIGYRRGEFATRNVTVSTSRDGSVRVSLLPTRGSFRGLPDRRDWQIRVHLDSSQTPILPQGATWEAPAGTAQRLSDLFHARGGGVVSIKLDDLEVSASRTFTIRL